MKSLSAILWLKSPTSPSDSLLFPASLEVEKTRPSNWFYVLWKQPAAMALLTLGLLPLFCEGEMLGDGFQWIAPVWMGLIILRWAWEWKMGRCPLPKTILLLLPLLIWQWVAALASPEPGISLAGAMRLTALACGGWATALLVAQRGEWKRYWLLALGLGLSIATIYALVRFPVYGKVASTPLFQDTNMLSAAICLLLPVAVAAWWSKDGSQKGGRWLVLLGVAVVVFASRGAWVSLGVAALISPALILQQKSWRIVWLAGSLVLMVAGGILLNRWTPSEQPTSKRLERLESIGDTKQDFSNRERLMRWKCAWRMALQRPIVGYGPSRFAPEFKHHLQTWEEVEQIAYWNGWRFGGHSDLMTFLAETGFVGAALFLFLLVGFGWASLRRHFQAKESRIPRAGLLLGLVTWLVHGAFNDLLSSDCIAVMVFFFVGMVFLPFEIAPQSVENHPKKLPLP